MFRLLSAIVVCLVASVGCGVLSTTTRLPPPPVYETATRQELVETVQRIASIESMKAVIYVTLSYLTAERTKEVLYRQVRGALVTRRPGWIRTTAETPGGIAKIYDMVSDGRMFQVHLPWRNRVYEGLNELTRISDNRVENLRPQHILEAIMLEPLKDTQKVILDIERYGRSGYQVLHEVEEAGDGNLRIRRKYWFSRSDLNLARLMILDEQTEIITDAWYREWLEDDGLPYPQHIRIERPKDAYTLEIEIIRQDLNAEIPNGSFDLMLPDGVERETVGEEPLSDS